MPTTPYYSPPPTPESVIKASKTLLGGNDPRDNAASLKAVRVQLSAEVLRDPALIKSMMVYVAVRADHKAIGGRYTIAETPGSEDTQVIYHDLEFPRCIAYGSTGSPEYVTEKVEVDSGAEQRNQRRRYPRHKFKIEMMNLPANEISEIMNLWHVCAGDAIGFLFLDPMDHTSANTADTMSGTDVTMTDQFVASAIGTQADYELNKSYQLGAHEVRRRIRYPDLDTLVVSVDGFALPRWSFSYDTGLLTFTKPLAVPLTASLSRSAGGVITGTSFLALQPGDLVYMTGWSNPAYNAPPGSDPARVVSASGTQLVLQKFDGTAYGADVLGPSTVTITSALPPTGAEIRAGFYFMIPVRFEDGDNMESEIKAGMRESAFADFGSISLREIFE